VKKLLNATLGVVTSIGGFIEVGSVSTSAQAGAVFGFGLLWAVAAATACLAFLTEMAGRLAAASKHTVADAVREHFGWSFYCVSFVTEIVLDTLVLAAELGGVCIAVRLLTGFQSAVLVIPVVALAWLLLWFLPFGAIEKGAAILGLVTLCFVWGAFRLKPEPSALVAGLVPGLPGHDLAQYGFFVVSILGATVSPYLLNFYASGAVEEKWDESDITSNRFVSALGMGFGGMVSASVLVVAAIVLHPRGIAVDSYEQAALMLVPAFARWGVPLFALALGIGCFGAALEIALNLGYTVSQAFGWNWSEELQPRREARFTVVYLTVLALAGLLMLTGLDPLRLTLVSMSLTVIVLPLVVFPFLVLLNDRRYMKEHTNGWLGNTIVVGVTVLGFLMALAVVPLQLLGGS
jgi:Mn2+/Fe2+ NRAMP family transporter